jgi:hypothetical protein
MIQPEMNMNFGNQTYYTNYVWDNLQTDEEFRTDFLNQTSIRRAINIIERNNPDATEDEILAILTQQYIEEDSDFNLSSIGIGLPITYIIGDFMINTSFSTYFLLNKPDYIEENLQTYFSFGISYSFMFD